MGDLFDSSPEGPLPLAPAGQPFDWTEEKKLELWNRRREAGGQSMSWTEFVDTYYPGVSLTAVRFKYYEMRDRFQPGTERQSSERLPYLVSSGNSSEVSFSDHESDTGVADLNLSESSQLGITETPQVLSSVAAGDKRARSTSDALNCQRKKVAGPRTTPRIPMKASTATVDPQRLSVAPPSGHERDEASIRLTRLTPQNWLYILEQAQACDVNTAKLEQVERELKNTAGRLAETEAELQFMRSKPRSQGGDSSDPESNSQEFQGSLQQLKATALELREAFTGFETRSRDCMPNINWQTEVTQKCVNAVKEKFEQHEKAIQALGGHTKHVAVEQ